jgi:hypothetical protein
VHPLQPLEKFLELLRGRRHRGTTPPQVVIKRGSAD